MSEEMKSLSDLEIVADAPQEVFGNLHRHDKMSVLEGLMTP